MYGLLRDDPLAWELNSIFNIEKNSTCQPILFIRKLTEMSRSAKIILLFLLKKHLISREISLIRELVQINGQVPRWAAHGLKLRNFKTKPKPLIFHDLENPSMDTKKIFHETDPDCKIDENPD